MRKFLSVLLGLALLAGAALLLWQVYGIQPTEARTTGGVLYSQEEVAALMASGEPMEAVADIPLADNTVPVQPEFAAAASADLGTLDTEEIQAAPSTIMQLEQTADVQLTAPLTTDIVLDDTTQVEVAPLAEGDGTATGPGQGGMGSATLGYEQRVVEIEWPRTFYVGRAGSVRVTLKPLAGGALQPVAEVEGNEVLATPILIADRYDAYNAYVTAAISAPDFSVESVTPATQPLMRGGEAEWRWTLKAENAQKSVIALSLTLSWEPKQAGDPPGPQNVPIWGQALQVEVNYIFGMLTVSHASLLGTVLGVLGLIAQFPLLEKVLEIMLAILFGRDRRSKDERRRHR